LLECIPSFGSCEFISVEESLAALQRRKDPDEIAVLRGSIAANMGAYEAVRQAIHPGVSELEVLAAGWRGATLTAQQKVFHDGDYQCGQFNGPARPRRIESGELYIVDAWTYYRCYWCDMARTFCVGRAPTSVQLDLYEHIRGVLRNVEAILQPGIDGTQVYLWLDEQLRKFPQLARQGLIHHGGHAIGLRNHEMPDVNPTRGGVLQSGNVICLEPGGYFPEANFGVRLENMYLITEAGCENLCPEVTDLPVCE
jgi:Xaa-Pro aminopeptidase